MAEITTQAELEDMLNDPERMKAYVKEQALDVLGTAVKEQMDEAMQDGAINRPPMSDEAVADSPIQGKGFTGLRMEIHLQYTLEFYIGLNLLKKNKYI